MDHLNTIVVLQKKCVRVLDGAPYNSHTTRIFKKLGILKLNDLYQYQVGVFMFESIKAGRIANSFSPHNLRPINIIDPTFQRLTTTQKSITHAGPKIWNKLPLQIRNQTQLHKFKVALKQYFLSFY